MESLSSELKRAREAKHLTLSDISDSTLINISFLEAIEQGNYSMLPQTYVRAFIREYAAVAGLDPADIMRKYDESLKNQEPPQDTSSQPVQEELPPIQRERQQIDPRLAKLAVIGMILLSAGIIVWNLNHKGIIPPTQEIPFQNVIKEHERRSAPVVTGQTEKPLTATRTSDSLTLKAITTDTVWIQIAIDKAPPKEFIFKPNLSIAWKAAEKFTLTLGNAGAIEFTLNNKHIGIMGKRGSVARSIEFTHQTLMKQ
jgi:cytoskeletal protein RodZ